MALGIIIDRRNHVFTNFAKHVRVLHKVKQRKAWVMSQTLSLREWPQNHPSFVDTSVIIHKEWWQSLETNFLACPTAMGGPS